MESFYKPIPVQNEGGIEALQMARKLKEERKQNTLKLIGNPNKTISDAARKTAIDEGWIVDNPDTLSNSASGLEDMRKAVSKTTAAEKPYQDTEGDPSQIKNNILKKGEIGYNEQKNATEKATGDYKSRLAAKNYEVDDSTGNIYKWKKGSDGKPYKELYATSDNFTGQDKADQFNKDMAMPGLGADQKAYDAQNKVEAVQEDVLNREMSSPSTSEKELKARMSEIPAAQKEADAAQREVTSLGSTYGTTADRAAIENRKAQDTKDAQGIAVDNYRKAVSDAMNVDDVYRRAFNEAGTSQLAYSKGMDYLEKNGASAETIKDYQRKFERQELTQDRGAYINPNEDMGKAQKTTGREKDIVSRATFLDGAFAYHSKQTFQKDYADAIRHPELWNSFIDKMVDATGKAGVAQEKRWRDLKNASAEAKQAEFKNLLENATTEDSPSRMASNESLTILPEDQKAAEEAGRPGDAAVYAQKRQNQKADDLKRLKAIKEGDDLFDASPEGQEYYLPGNREKAKTKWKIAHNLPVEK